MAVDEMKIEEQEQAVTVNPTSAPGGNLPTTKLGQLNDEFEGIGEAMWAKRVVIDGNKLLYKDRDQEVDSITCRLKGGRKVHQVFIEESNLFVKSYDGKFTEEGEPVSKYPGMRHCFEIDWEEEIDGDSQKHQMVLSPTGRYAFQEYAEKLAKLAKPLKVSQVDTIITVTRVQNKEGQRYSKPQFTAKELA